MLTRARLLLPLLSLLLVLAGCGDADDTATVPVADPEHYRAFENADALAAYLRPDSEAGPLVGAHRGGPEPGRPENALSTFTHTLRHGPALIETDVRMTQDSVLVLLHDETLDRTTTGRGPVREHTLAELRSLRLVDETGTRTPFRLPTVAEALSWAEGRAVLQLDVKQDVPRPLVLRALRRADGFNRAVVITYTLDDAAWYHRRAPTLILSAAAETAEEANALVDRVAPARLVGFVGVGEAADGAARVFAENDVRVTLGTFGDLDARARRQGLAVYHRLFDEGIHIVATDEPALASQAAASYRPAAPP